MSLINPLSRVKTFIANAKYPPKKVRRFLETQMFVIIIFIFFGDSLKLGRILGLQYTWMAGHFADIGLPAQCTTALYYVFGHFRSGRLIAALLPPVPFILYEYSQMPNADPHDVICYCLGSALASFTIFLFVLVNRKQLTELKNI